MKTTKNMTIAELKHLIEYLPDNAVVKICNGHSIWAVTEYEYDADDSGYPKDIILTNPNMPK